MARKNRSKCKYCGSGKHSSNDCGLYRFAKGKQPELRIGIVTSFHDLGQALNNIHEIKKKRGKGNDV